MPKGPPPQWKKRKEPILDDHVKASVSVVGGVFDTNGHYGILIYAGIETRDRANEIKQALYRSAGHLGYSLKTDIVKADDGTYQVHYRAVDKAHARMYVVQKYGEDRSKWPYDPRAKAKKK